MKNRVKKPPNGLKAARERKGMTQEEAAPALGISVSAYRKKEQGRLGLKADFINRTCEIFGCKPEDIILVNSSGQSPSSEQLVEIDQEKLASLMAISKDRIASLEVDEAKKLLLALISAARTPHGTPRSLRKPEL